MLLNIRIISCFRQSKSDFFTFRVFRCETIWSTKYSLMLSAKRDQVVHWGFIVTLYVRSEKLPALAEPNARKTTRKLRDVGQLIGRQVDLLVRIHKETV